MIGRIQLVIGIALALIMCPLAYLLFDGHYPDPYDYDGPHSFIVPERSQAGTVVEVHWAVKVNRTCPGKITRSLVDIHSGIKTTYEPAEANVWMHIGDHYLEKTFTLPPAISAGPKLYRANGEYVCNWLNYLWPLRQQTPDLFFEVLP